MNLKIAVGDMSNLIRETESMRDMVMQNFSWWAKEFKGCLREIIQEKPSAEGKICNMDFQQFSTYIAFQTLKQIEASENDEYLMLDEQDKAQIKLYIATMRDELRKIFDERAQELNVRYNFKELYPVSWSD